MKAPGPIQIKSEMYEDIYGRFPVVQQGDEPGKGYFVSSLATRVNTNFFGVGPKKHGASEREGRSALRLGRDRN